MEEYPCEDIMLAQVKKCHPETLFMSLYLFESLTLLWSYLESCKKLFCR